MIDSKYIELMNKEIDNVITKEERIKLHEYLASNEYAKGYFNELLLTNNYLNEIPDEDPSENLKKSIINSIDFNKYSPKVKSKSSWNYFFNPKLKLVYTFAVGLLAGLIIYGVISNYTNKFNTEEMSGTIGLENKTVSLVKQIPVKISNISGKIEITKQGNKFWLNIDLESSQKYNIIVAYPDEVRFKNINPAPGCTFTCNIGKNNIVTSNSGIQNYSLLFSQFNLPATKLNLMISQSGKIIYNHNLTLER
jgi:hypothetical protein